MSSTSIAAVKQVDPAAAAELSEAGWTYLDVRYVAGVSGAVMCCMTAVCAYHAVLVSVLPYVHASLSHQLVELLLLQITPYSPHR